MYFYPDDEDVPELAAYLKERGIKYIHASEREGSTRADVAGELLAFHRGMDSGEVFHYPCEFYHYGWQRWVHKMRYWLPWKLARIFRSTP